MATLETRCKNGEVVIVEVDERGPEVAAERHTAAVEGAGGADAPPPSTELRPLTMNEQITVWFATQSAALDRLLVYMQIDLCRRRAAEPESAPLVPPNAVLFDIANWSRRTRVRAVA